MECGPTKSAWPVSVLIGDATRADKDTCFCVTIKFLPVVEIADDRGYYARLLGSRR